MEEGASVEMPLDEEEEVDEVGDSGDLTLTTTFFFDSSQYLHGQDY